MSLMENRGMLEISIHSLVKRETKSWLFLPSGEGYFNPLPRKEGDHYTVFACKRDCNDFNPLPRKEGDMARPAVLHFQ